MLELGKRLNKHGTSEPALSKEEIHALQEKELEATLSDVTIESTINPLLGMPG